MTRYLILIERAKMNRFTIKDKNTFWASLLLNLIAKKFLFWLFYWKNFANHLDLLRIMWKKT